MRIVLSSCIKLARLLTVLRSLARCQADNADGAYLVNYIMQYIQAADSHQLRLVPHKGEQYLTYRFS